MLPVVSAILAGLVALLAAANPAWSVKADVTPELQMGACQASNSRVRRPGASARHRVIVTLRVPNYSPGNTAAIAAAQNKVLASISRLGVVVERKYPNLPQMALSVSGAALRRLRGHADVISVEADGLSAPMR